MWRRLPRAGKAAVVLIPIAIIGLVLALGPGIERSKQERAALQSEQRAEAVAARAERARAEQRPRRGGGPPAGTDLVARRRLLDEVTAAILVDARERVAAGALAGPILRVECEPFPRTVNGTPAHDDPNAPTGRYACLAVTHDLPARSPDAAGSKGHPYRVGIDFESGSYAFCKIAGSPGKTIPIAGDPLVPLARECGGS
jgi:type II secretory pathway pseudopilin PulG